MSILVNTGFKVGSAEPLDEYSVRETVADRDDLATNGYVYEGMCVYVKENKKIYIYNGTTWEEFVGGSGSSEEQIKDWVSGSSYLEGDYTYHEGEIYRCLTSNNDVDFDEANWKQLTYGIDELSKEDVEGLLGLTEEEIEAMEGLILDTEVRIDKTYSSSKIYTDIQQCLEDSKTYTLKELEKVKIDDTLTTTDKTIVGAINEVKLSIPTRTSDLNNDSNYVKSTELSTVATSGSYNDLTDKPIADDMEYRRLIDNSVYGKMGDFLGIQAGYLRKYNKPKKIVVLGNSLTLHGRYEADGIEWTVDDYREMASSLPNSGWVSKIQQYITQNVNPDCKVYKANISTWEKATNGRRTWKDASSNVVCEVKTDRPYLVDGETVDTILTEDTDIVILQVYENISSPTTPAEKLNLAKDYINLYSTIREKCPNVKLYQFCGFWHSETKTQSVIGACRYSKVVPIQALTTIANFNMSHNISIYSASGSAIYDGEGNQIATVSSAVSGHPNDKGFNVMATYVINALYNEITFNNSQTVLQFRRTTTVDNPRITELFNTDYSGGSFTEHYKQWFNYFLIPGEYSATVSLNGNPAHGTFKVICTLSQSFNLSGENPSSVLMYYPLRQEWRSHNTTIDSGLITRCTKISSDDSVWGDFKINTYTK